jgi:hypothetical protein
VVRLALLIGAVFLFAPGANAQSSTSPQPISLTAAARAEADKATVERKDPEKSDAATEAEAAQVDAQRRTRLQLGVALKQTISPGSDTDSSFKPTFVWRWRGKGSRTDDRLSPSYRLSSFSSVVHSQIGSRDLEVGNVKVRPLMVGLDYKMPRGKWNWAAGMSVGWALNKVEVPWQMRAIAETAGTMDLWVDAHNSLVWGPRLKGWYDFDRRLSFMVESAYLITRPELDVRANGVTSTRRLNADAFIVKAGVVYGIF